LVQSRHVRANAGVHKGGKALGRAIVLFQDLVEHVVAREVKEGVAGGKEGREG